MRNPNVLIASGDPGAASGGGMGALSGTNIKSQSVNM